MGMGDIVYSQMVQLGMLTLTSMLAERERRHQSIQAGFADVDAGRVVSHSDMVDFANRLKET